MKKIQRKRNNGKKVNLTDQRFGRLVVLEEAGRKNGKVTWLCQCDCGKTVPISAGNLKSGNSKSCGCLWVERKAKHGWAGTPTHKAWRNMLARCYNPNTPYYKYYGGRGIEVCERWWEFENFLADMGEKPKGKSLDRISPNGNYMLDNCRWSIWQEQQNNTRSKGYTWSDKDKKWVAQIMVDYRHIGLGWFNTEKEARQAYTKAKWKYHGVWLDE